MAAGAVPRAATAPARMPRLCPLSRIEHDRLRACDGDLRYAHLEALSFARKHFEFAPCQHQHRWFSGKQVNLAGAVLMIQHVNLDANRLAGPHVNTDHPVAVRHDLIHMLVDLDREGPIRPGLTAVLKEEHTQGNRATAERCQVKLRAVGNIFPTTGPPEWEVQESRHRHSVSFMC